MGSKSWKEDVERMNEVLDREGVRSAVLGIYSPERVNGIASKAGILKGWSLDLTTADPLDGKPWDFTVKAKRDRAMDMVLRKEALLVIGSPMCRAFSQLQSFNGNIHRDHYYSMVNHCVSHINFAG